MRTKVFVLMSLCLTLFVGKASAQWTVVDPTNLAQGIVNSCREIVQTSTTAGDGEDLRAGKEILRCPEEREQPGPRCPQGAADHRHGGRHHRHLRQLVPEDDERRELFR